MHELYKLHTKIFIFIHHAQLRATREDLPIAILEDFNIDLYSPTYIGADGSNPLHIAAEKGFTTFTKLALDRGFTKLVLAKSRSELPVQLALMYDHYDTAAVLLKEMND